MLPRTEPAQLELATILERLAPGSEGPLAASLRPPTPCESWVRLRCPGCGASLQKRSGCARLCPSCPRRGGVRASAIVSVIPRVPVRHWIYTPGDAAQAVLREDPELLRWLARRFVREVFAQIGAALSDPQLQCGAATVVHWVRQSIEPSVHLHAAALDGGYVRDRDGPRFIAVDDALPADAALEVARRLRKALHARLRARAEGPSRTRTPRTPQASPIVTRKEPRPRAPKVAGARADDASVRVTPALAAGDRPGLVRLARYLTRPWIEPSRVEVGEGGRATVAMSRARRDGARALEWDAGDLHARILGAAPPSATHPIAFHGVLAPRASMRSELVPGQLPLLPSLTQDRRPRPRRPERCRRCGFALVIDHVEVAVDDIQAG